MLTFLGLNHTIKEQNHLDDTSDLARVIAVHKEKYIVRNAEGTFRGEITGNLRYNAASNADFPAVGDWVKIMPMDSETIIITEILERYSKLERKAAGKASESQIVATNIDTAFIVMALNQDFNVNRLDRYIAICKSGNVQPEIILTKKDLITEDDLKEKIQQINGRHSDIPIIALSVSDPESFDKLLIAMEKHKTYCLIGSSGAGKSTIINVLDESIDLKTSGISAWNSKGRHTTTHRELFILNNESIMIDTPGMREVGILGDASAIDDTFDNIAEMGLHCRYSDCSHTQEVGCAVIEAVENGDISEGEYNSYLKLKREQKRFSTSEHEKRKSDKVFCKAVRAAVKTKKKYKR